MQNHPFFENGPNKVYDNPEQILIDSLMEHSMWGLKAMANTIFQALVRVQAGTVSIFIRARQGTAFFFCLQLRLGHAAAVSGGRIGDHRCQNQS